MKDNLFLQQQFEPIKVSLGHECGIFVQINYSFELLVPQTHLSFQYQLVALVECHSSGSLLIRHEIKYCFLIVKKCEEFFFFLITFMILQQR